MSLNIIETHTDEEHAKTLVYNLPSGKVFRKKFDNSSKLYKFIFAIAQSFKLFDDDLNRLFRELNPETTIELITEFEKSVAIPDNQFSGTGTIEKRRRDVQAKRNAQGIQTVTDYENYFELLGYDVEIIGDGNNPALYGYPWTWYTQSTIDQSVGFHNWNDTTQSKNRFWLVVKFFDTYTDLDELREFMKTIAPANVFIKFIEG